jgi:hypothetical protein
MPNSLTPFETLLKHCEEQQIHYRSDADKKCIHFTLWDAGFTNYLAPLYNITWFITDSGILRMNLALPVRVSDKKMQPLVIEAVTRANYGLTVGHFNLDMSDGEVEFHMYYPIGAAGLEYETVGDLFIDGLYTCDRFFPAFMRVMFGGLAPQDAIELAWLDDQSEEGADTKTSAPAKKRPTAKKTRRPRKKNAHPKGEGTDHPPKGC